jgi:hypothetical protein
MDESGKHGFRIDFDRSVWFEFNGAMITSDAGLLAFRELNENTGLSVSVGNNSSTFSTSVSNEGWNRNLNSVDCI